MLIGLTHNRFVKKIFNATKYYLNIIILIFKVPYDPKNYYEEGCEKGFGQCKSVEWGY